jgi:hypothetical protein
MQAETMESVLLVFVIGVLNLALGYALAVYLGLGPPTLTDTWRLLGFARPIGKISNGRDDAIGEPVQSPYQQQAVSPPDAPLPAAVPEASAPVLKPEGIDLDTLRRSVAMSVSNLTDFAARLTRSNRGDHQRTAWGFVAELQGICQPYLEHLKLAAERLSDQLCDKVQELVLEQAAQLETTLSNLQYMDFDSGVSAAMGRLSQETGNTLSMARRLQQAIEAPPGTADQKASEESPQSLQVEPAVPG